MDREHSVRLTPADLRRALKFVHEYCAPDGVENLISRALEGLFRLFPCLVANYGEVDPVRRTGFLASYPTDTPLRHRNDPALSMGFQELEPVFRNRSGRAVRLSELVNVRTFRRTRMFQDFFEPAGGRDLLVIRCERNDGLAEFFSLFRQGYFSDRDRVLLDAVAFPLQSALTNARALAYLYDHRSMLESGLRNSGWNTLIASHRGRILVETPQARSLLSFHFGSQPRGGLPDDLLHWIDASRRRFEALSSAVPAEPAPFTMATSGKLLIVRMLLHPSGCLLLLREEDEKSGPEWEPLTRLGLSRREAQVLNLIAMGKTGPEISILLRISHDTVRKHTSHILEKLGVETRTAAAAVALETLQAARRP